MHEVSFRKCGLITQLLCRVAIEIVELPLYEGLPKLFVLLMMFEEKVSGPQRLLAMEEALKATPTHWQETHKKRITGWSQCQHLMTVRFGNTEVYHAEKYDEWNHPSGHLTECQALWASRPKDEWVHAFIHTLDEIPRSQYVSVELRREITTWEELTVFFAHTFSFTDGNHDVNNALQII